MRPGLEEDPRAQEDVVLRILQIVQVDDVAEGDLAAVEGGGQTGR